MKFTLSLKQTFYIKATLATLLFASAFLQSVLSSKTNEEQISNRINDAISGLVEQNESTVYDWASWDDTVELAQQQYKDYFNDNFNADTARILQLAIVTNDTKEPIAGEVWNENDNSFRSLELGRIKKIAASFHECGSSFTATLDDNYLISSSYISPTENQADDLTYGCLYFGKRIPDPKLSSIFASITNNSHLNIKKVSIRPSAALGEKLEKSKSTLTIEGGQSGLFGSDIIAEKNQPLLSFYQLLLIGLYALLMVMLVQENTKKRIRLPEKS